MLIEATLFFVLLLGMVGLGIDGTRLFLLKSNAQFAVSSASAAGAKQLDGKDGAIQRATDAANAVASANISATMANQFTNAVVTGITFYSALPSTTTTIDAEAKFLKVSAQANTAALFPFTPIALTAAAEAVD